MATSAKNNHSAIELLRQAKEAEAKGDLKTAAKFYEALIGRDKADDFPFDRLMIIYRKLKQPSNELRVIKKGLKLFENLYKPELQKGRSKNKMEGLSAQFMKTTGLLDKKGRVLYQPEPLARWNKRKNVVEKKLK